MGFLGYGNSQKSENFFWGYANKKFSSSFDHLISWSGSINLKERYSYSYTLIEG